MGTYTYNIITISSRRLFHRAERRKVFRADTWRLAEWQVKKFKVAQRAIKTAILYFRFDPSERIQISEETNSELPTEQAVLLVLC